MATEQVTTYEYDRHGRVANETVTTREIRNVVTPPEIVVNVCCHDGTTHNVREIMAELVKIDRLRGVNITVNE